MQQGTAYIPLSGYAAGLVRLSGGLYVIRCAVSHQKSIFLSSALDDTNGILALMVSSCLVPPPASCGEERHIFPAAGGRLPGVGRRKRSGAQGMPPCSHCRMYKSYFSQMCESIKIFYEMIKVFGFSVGYSASPCAPISNQPKHQTGQTVLLMLSWMALFLLAPIFRLHFYLGRSTQIKRTFSTHFSPSASSASPGTRSRAIPPRPGSIDSIGSALLSFPHITQESFKAFDCWAVLVYPIKHRGRLTHSVFCSPSFLANSSQLLR